MRGRAFAKVNLGLRVSSPRSDGYHPIVSLVQSVDWADTLAIELADEDRFDLAGEGPAGPDNLAWRAVEAVRGRGGRPLHLTLDKSIAVAAGLGGGSADAALALVLTVAALELDIEDAVAAAPDLGADVAFCLSGGTAWMEGIGEVLTPIRTPDDFCLALVVPPFALATPEVYRRWDALGEPVARGVDGRDLPVSLRDHGPFGNDLQPAALDLEPALGDWMSDLSARWGQPVLMSGSGPTLFGFFPTSDEARDALGAAPDARAIRVVHPVRVGWEVEEAPGLPGAPWR